MLKNSLSRKLKNLIDKLPEDDISILEIKQELSADGTLLLIALLTSIFLIPISIPGLSTVFGGAIILISISLILGKELWLPSKISNKEFPSIKVKKGLNMGLKYFIYLEKIIQKNRLQIFTKNLIIKHINNMAILVGGLLLLFPFGFIPFSNTLPALAILCLCIGIMENDGFIIFLGYLFNILSMLYFMILVSGGGYVLYEILRYFGFN